MQQGDAWRRPEAHCSYYRRTAYSAKVKLIPTKQLLTAIEPHTAHAVGDTI